MSEGNPSFRRPVTSAIAEAAVHAVMDDLVREGLTILIRWAGPTREDADIQGSVP